ncbi:DUF1428 domain-containing protein [Marinicella meishanensis]|uniref:DUF1428 domain-containing protein n=1 Tax=Marinicella meishanensis TaxID=2873263 RepID=UPI001CBE5933|nr:DUF1428 family protein [Marinicella sp. NBU2979]
MNDYIDGFALPIPKAHLKAYQSVASAIAAIWVKHGALDYREFVGDDLQLAGTRSFLDAVAVEEDEVVVFGWVRFACKADRDAANERVAADPEVAKLMAASNSGFDPSRMAYGGFVPLVSHHE